MENQIKFAQQEVYKAGKELVCANMRLEGTKFEADAKRACNALQKLNDKLVKHLQKK